MSKHTYFSPVLERALVEDVMCAGIIDCPPETDLVTLSRLMADNNVHAIVVNDLPNSWGIVTALDLVAAALPGREEPDAGSVATTEVVTIEADEQLERAAQLMVEHQLTHLVVTKEGRPVGILSTLDIARRLAANDDA